MNLRKALQWLIALVCTAAAVLNILYLTGAQPKSVTSIGCAAILACYVLQWVARRAVPAAKTENAGDNTPLDRARVILTLAAAAVWIVTIGMSFFWKV